MNDAGFLSYFCPFSSTNFDACSKFKSLSTGQKVVTIALTFFATLISLPILGLAGLAVFRAIVEKYTICRIDSNNQEILPGGNRLNNQTLATAEKTGRRAADDMCLGFKTDNFQDKNKKLLEILGLRIDNLAPLQGAPKPKPNVNISQPETHIPRFPKPAPRVRSNSSPTEVMLQPGSQDGHVIEEENGSATVEAQHQNVKEKLAAACQYLDKLAVEEVTSENEPFIRQELTKIEVCLSQDLP